jgi:hypothetical protein
MEEMLLAKSLLSGAWLSNQKPMISERPLLFIFLKAC